MNLYRKTIATHGPQKLTLLLKMLGATTKPYFMCELTHTDNSPIACSPGLTFFLEQMPEATPAVDAAVSLARGFEACALSSPLPDLVAVAIKLQKAMQWLEPDKGAQWTKIAGACIGMEMEWRGKAKV